MCSIYLFFSINRNFGGKSHRPITYIDYCSRAKILQNIVAKMTEKLQLVLGLDQGVLLKY